MTHKPYYNETLDFYIEIPITWQLLPTSWVHTARSQARMSNSDIQQTLRRSKDPFLALQKSHGEPDISYPTVQATSREGISPANLDTEGLLNQMVDHLREITDEFQLEEKRTDRSVSGLQALFLKARFSMLNQHHQRFQCRCRQWCVLAQHRAFVIGMSGPNINYQGHEEEQAQMLDSILIDQGDHLCW